MTIKRTNDRTVPTIAPVELRTSGPGNAVVESGKGVVDSGSGVGG